jgi:membrane-bound inhibitor of C-type lysozyme
MPDGEYLLHRERTASGARYRGDGVDFWDRGAEARFETSDGTFQCTRLESTRQ